MPMTVHGTSVWISLTRAGGRAEAQTLVSSSDAGAQLSVRRSPCVSELGGTLAASSSTVVWAVCPTGMAAGAWRSTDGGARWMALNLRSAGGTASPLTNAATIGPASDTTAVITTGGDRTPIRTTNGGQSFTRVSGGPASGDWGYVGFTDPLTGTALITGAGAAGTSSGLPAYGLWRSGDGGTHWGGPVRVG
jgi:hypothetical protein